MNVFDVVGAEIPLAALTYAYLMYNDIAAAITIANKASAIAVQHYGCYVLSNEEAHGFMNKTIAFNITHDASACKCSGGDIEVFLEEERLSRIKNDEYPVKTFLN